MEKSRSRRNASSSNPNSTGSIFIDEQAGEENNDSDDEDSEDDDFIYIPISDILDDCGVEVKNDGKQKVAAKEIEDQDDNMSLSDSNSSDMLFEDDNWFTLPPHRTCSCHNIHLIATTDVNNITDPNFRKLKLSTDLKLKKLWNKQSRSTVSEDLIQDTLGSVFVRSIDVGWNSYYDALKRVVSLTKRHPEKFQSLFDAFRIPKLRQVEIDFISEYVKVMKPLADALDVMQNEENISIGCVLPVINLLKKVIGNFQKDKTVKLCQPLLAAVQSGIEKRFGKLFNNTLLQLAAVSDPRYKTVWVENDQAMITKLLKDQVASQQREAQHN